MTHFDFASVQWPDLPFDIEKHACLVMRRGSESHGLYIPPEDEMGTDDRDLMVVVVPPLEYVFGLATWNGTAESIKGVWDVVVYDWRKFVHLLVKQNPNVVGTLWLAEEDYLHRNEIGRWICDARLAFRARHPAYVAFSGYACAQMKKMENGAREGYMGAKRKLLVEKFGYDTKNATHLIRLLRMGTEFLRDGTMQVRRTADAEELKAIKHGKYTLAEIKEIADIEFRRCDSLLASSVVPPEVDRAAIEHLLLRVAAKAYGAILAPPPPSTPESAPREGK